mmetsp:Transcript_14103/g.35355  ORF Transcript_14103/g.35355 Transcript_14103/m.35355 type:complete len:234 (+) Transcript_14103:1494-2195(+)
MSAPTSNIRSTSAYSSSVFSVVTSMPVRPSTTRTAHMASMSLRQYCLLETSATSSTSRPPALPDMDPCPRVSEPALPRDDCAASCSARSLSTRAASHRLLKSSARCLRSPHPFVRHSGVGMPDATPASSLRATATAPYSSTSSSSAAASETAPPKKSATRCAMFTAKLVAGSCLNTLRLLTSASSRRALSSLSDAVSTTRLSHVLVSRHPGWNDASRDGSLELSERFAATLSW